jgi:hypothetical protein
MLGMRQTDTKEITFNITFALGQLGNSWYQTLAGANLVRREAAAQFICGSVLSKFREPMFFDAESMPINHADIEARITTAMLELGPLTYNAARNGHQETRREARAVIVERIMERLGAIKILVADPEGNIFGDVIKRKPPGPASLL